MQALLPLLLGLLLAALGAPAARAQPLAETALKLRLVLSLSRFTQWPGTDAAAASPGAPEPLRLCVLQRQPEVAQAFAAVDGQVVGSKRVQIVRNPSADACDLLYLHSSAEPPGALLKSVANRAVLTISDAEGFVARNGMVELVLVNDTLRFDVNLAALRQARLALSSQALRLARQVRD